MTTPNRPPLWRVMFDAYDTAPAAPPEADNDWTDRHGYAAEIRALADWLVPREKELPDLVHGGTRFARQAERRRLRNLLISEAVRAERGKVE